MSDLSATNCGCGNMDNCNGFGGLSSCVWIIILLLCCGGCGNGRGDGCGFGGDSCIWIILILLFCCNGNGNGCGCGC